jgi:hypothetical protein
LALFGRRPPQRVESIVIPAAENLHNRRLKKSWRCPFRLFAKLMQPFDGAANGTCRIPVNCSGQHWCYRLASIFKVDLKSASGPARLLPVVWIHFWEELMKLPRRQFLQLAAGATALPAVSRVAGAQAYPARPVRIIVTFAAGSANDVNGRLIGQWLSERLRQPFIVESRPGGGGKHWCCRGHKIAT